MKKTINFFACILPNYVHNEITKEFWKKIAISKIWQLVSFWGVKTHFCEIPLKWCIFKHDIFFYFQAWLKVKKKCKIILSMILFYYFSLQLLLSNIFDCRWWKLPMCTLEKMPLVKGQSTFCQKFGKGKWWIQPSTNNITAKHLWGWA